MTANDIRDNADFGSVDKLNIPLISGDGVGPELAAAARQCLEALDGIQSPKISLVEYPAGYSAYKQTGNPLPEETISAMRNSPATLLTGLSARDCPPPSPMGKMRTLLGLYADIRHCVSTHGSRCPGIDLIIIRECSEGFLSDRNMFKGSGEFMPSPDMVLSVRVITREKCTRIAELAFEYAQAHGRKKITIAHKNVVFSLGCGLFRHIVFEKAGNYPEIEIEEEFVDALAGNLVVNPERYDMILTTNLFGDILADIATAQVGSLVPIINAGNYSAVFYPAHGALTQHAGKERINPLAMIHTLSSMLHWLKLHNAGGLLDKALSACEDSVPSDTLILPAGITTQKVAEVIVNSINSQRSISMSP